MTPKQKILAIRLSEKIAKQTLYANSIGIRIKSNEKKEKSN